MTTPLTARLIAHTLTDLATAAHERQAATDQNRALDTAYISGNWGSDTRMSTLRQTTAARIAAADELIADLQYSIRDTLEDENLLTTELTALIERVTYGEYQAINRILSILTR